MQNAKLESYLQAHTTTAQYAIESLVTSLSSGQADLLLLILDNLRRTTEEKTRKRVIYTLTKGK